MLSPGHSSPLSWWANEGFEYWFSRPVRSPRENPLIIVGGGRGATGPRYEHYVVDDSVVRKDAGKVLRDFLPELFPGKFDLRWSG
jgi:hypothetical protein